MGYVYTLDGKLCCDVCGAHPARKIKCPVNWCPAYAACAKCKTKVKAQDHSNCRERQAERNADRQRVLNGGLIIRLYPDTSQCEPTKVFWRPCVNWLYSACSDVFNKTWLDRPDIERLQAMGHTITYGERDQADDEVPVPVVVAATPPEQLSLLLVQ